MGRRPEPSTLRQRAASAVRVRGRTTATTRSPLWTARPAETAVEIRGCLAILLGEFEFHATQLSFRAQEGDDAAVPAPVERSVSRVHA
jgi:hypothetical protein